MNIQKLVLATANGGKLKELQGLLQPLQIEVLPQSDFVTESVEETGLTFIENALLKARWATQHSGLPALADDSGLVVDAIHGEPGLYSSRYAGENSSEEENRNKLLQSLENVQESARTAHFYCAIVFLRYARDPAPIIATGRWEGRILSAPRGSQGFGYDPLFWVESHQKSAAELPRELKSELSHRGQAMKEFLLKLPGGAKAF